MLDGSEVLRDGGRTEGSREGRVAQVVKPKGFSADAREAQCPWKSPRRMWSAM
jgi:hypothetical protein